MTGAVYCLDSGTTSVKAACFTSDGRLLALAEVVNGALRRNGIRVEQDMPATQEEAFGVLRRCVDQSRGMRASAIIVTGQGDGLWPVDRTGAPCGQAITWLDGRTRDLVTEYGDSGALQKAAAILMTQPTTASQPVHLAWLARHEPDRLARVAHALRCKEWLFYGLTGYLLSEPSGAMPSWGDARRQVVSPDIQRLLGLPRGLELLPEILPVRDTVRALTEMAAARTGLPAGLPVMLGPSDVQATAIGLGVGMQDGPRRASVFGTSAIHMRLLARPEGPLPGPPGAILQPFVEPGLYLHVHPSFNGTAAFACSERLLGAGGPARPAYSGLILHPFFESGGERAPITNAHACASLFGMTATTTASEIAWAAREALAFVARMSHEAMGSAEHAEVNDDAVALGGGLAADTGFAHLIATVLGRVIQRSANPHAGLVGLGLVAISVLSGSRLSEQTAAWQAMPVESIAPEQGPIAAYAGRKYTLFQALLNAVMPSWRGIAELAAEAQGTSAHTG